MDFTVEFDTEVKAGSLPHQPEKRAVAVPQVSVPFHLVPLCEMIPSNMAGLPGELRHVAFYRNHSVKFYYEDGADRPWRFVFEDGLAISTEPKTVLLWDDPSEIDLPSAKAAALVLARKRFGGWTEENWDDWIDVSEDKA